MNVSRSETDDSTVVIEGGTIPGLPDAPAFVFSGHQPSPVPIIIAVPHAGRMYPQQITERLRHPASAALRLEDRYVDRLAKQVAKNTGAMLLVAQAPRVMIDLNRATGDVDLGMFTGRKHSVEASQSREHSGRGLDVLGHRARSGLGLIPRRLSDLGEIWKSHHTLEELDERIAGIHQPYHAFLKNELGKVHDRWGAALLIDMHSMPSLPRNPGQDPVDFVLGDRFGASCDGSIVASVFNYFAEMRSGATLNRPYAGGYVLDLHAAPGCGKHALQLEIDRRLYLDANLMEPGEGFDETVQILTGLVRRLAGLIAGFGEQQGFNRYKQAAE